VEYGVPPDRVVITASSSEAYAYLFHILADPGDEILAPAPSYPLFEQLAALEGLELRSYPLFYDGRWSLGPLERGPRSRAVLAVSPNNPTGQYLQPEERRSLLSLGLPLLVDEVFAPYPLEGSAYSNFSLREPVIILDGLSKRVGLPQMKTGWILLGGPDSFALSIRARLEHLADAFLSVSAPVQRALPQLLRWGQLTREAIQTRIKSNLSRLRERVKESALEVPRVEGGWYALLRLPRICSEEEWLLRFLKVGVQAQPGYFYDFPYEAQAVISLLTPRADFEEGIMRILGEVSDALSR